MKASLTASRGEPANMLINSLPVLAAVDDSSFLERLVATDGNPRLFMRALSKNIAV